MPDNMSQTYIGAHGTSRRCADIIQEQGFKISHTEEWQGRFGPGLYMYLGDEEGIANARHHAQFKYFDEPVTVLLPTFKYDKSRCLYWNALMDALAMARAREEAKKEGRDTPADEDIYAAQRRMITYLEKRSGVAYQAVFADFARAPTGCGKSRDGCCLYDLSLLAPRPYKEA